MKSNIKQNLEEVNYLEKINKERIKINEELNNILTELIRKGEDLANYEIWVNKKCETCIQPIYIINKYVKDMEVEGFENDTAFIILKIDSEV